jgi:hypothetical protein
MWRRQYTSENGEGEQASRQGFGIVCRRALEASGRCGNAAIGRPADCV